MYDSLRCLFATLVPKLSDSVLPYGPAGLRMTLAAIHHRDQRKILPMFIFCWRRQPLRGGSGSSPNGFIAFPLFVFVITLLRLDCQRLIRLKHFTLASGQIDPNDESVASYRRAFLRSTRCNRAQFSAGVNAMPGRQICVVDDVV